MELILVLGCQIGDELDERLNVALNIYQELQSPIFIVSGRGSKLTEGSSESYFMKRYLIYMGISPDIIYEEPYSISTVENIIFTKMILTQFKDISTIHVVSSEYHLPRIKMIINYFNLAPHVDIYYHGSLIYDDTRETKEKTIMPLMTAVMIKYDKYLPWEHIREKLIGNKWFNNKVYAPEY